MELENIIPTPVTNIRTRDVVLVSILGNLYAKRITQIDSTDTITILWFGESGIVLPNDTMIERIEK
jgi:hypothetical protein